MPSRTIIGFSLTIFGILLGIFMYYTSASATDQTFAQLKKNSRTLSNELSDLANSIEETDSNDEPADAI